MERRDFMQKTLMASTAFVLPENNMLPPQKGFKVKALETRYKEKMLFGNTPVDFKLLSTDTENRLSIFVSSNNIKGFGPPLHVHYTFDEFFCVLDGDFMFQLDDEKIPMTTGDFIFIPRKVKHSFDYVGNTQGTLLVGITQGKDMEKYFSDMLKVIKGSDKPDMAAMQAVYKKYNSEVLGPPPVW